MVSASGICLEIRESIFCHGMQPWEGERGNCKASQSGCKRALHPNRTYADVVSSSVCFPFVSPGVMIRKWETHME